MENKFSVLSTNIRHTYINNKKMFFRNVINSLQICITYFIKYFLADFSNIVFNNLTHPSSFSRGEKISESNIKLKLKLS